MVWLVVVLKVAMAVRVITDSGDERVAVVVVQVSSSVRWRWQWSGMWAHHGGLVGEWASADGGGRSD
jgi:hypothetical protein